MPVARIIHKSGIIEEFEVSEAQYEQLRRAGATVVDKEKPPTPVKKPRVDDNCPDCDSIHHRGCRS